MAAQPGFGPERELVAQKKTQDDMGREKERSKYTSCFAN